MTVFSYERGSKKVIFDTNDDGNTIGDLGDELWFMPFKGQSELPEKITWEIILSGTVTAGVLDLEGTLGQEEGFSGPSVHGDKAASSLAWVEIDTTPALTTPNNLLRFVVDKKVRAVRVKVDTALVGAGARAIVAISA